MVERIRNFRIVGRSAGDGDSQVIELSDQRRPIDAAEPKIGSVWNTRNAATADTCIPGLAQQIALQLIAEFQRSFELPVILRRHHDDAGFLLTLDAALD